MDSLGPEETDMEHVRRQRRHARFKTSLERDSDETGGGLTLDLARNRDSRDQRDDGEEREDGGDAHSCSVMRGEEFESKGERSEESKVSVEEQPSNRCGLVFFKGSTHEAGA